jgi:predicted nucleic acid-binding Zn ribbon protein
VTIVACHECGDQISTEAKVCPQCGARNRSRRAPRLLKWGLIIAVGAVALVVILGYFATGPSLCESYLVRHEFVRAFDRGPFAQREHVHVVDIVSQRTISRGERIEDEVCEIEFRTSDNKPRTYTLDFVKSEIVGYLIHLKEK